MPILRRKPIMKKSDTGSASVDDYQKDEIHYHPVLIHPKLEERVLSNFGRGKTADVKCRFVADILCTCGALANLWSDSSGLFVWCRECGDFRMLDSEGIEDLGDALDAWDFGAETGDQSNWQQV
jgi:hypothetical protein